ncbi:MAG: acyl-CoA dehydratase activase [Peptoniphilaceae bacterium]|uniref:acyl-CoA dehydratase activase n=1 Tax=Parvimonas sp. TaxID=1944660 RepID=UPI0025F4F09E|nr:acyl-CoA dehydratase activase [Parvimonas sp.]MCI5997885.1 acyl-CoA dehydratase activase [Parvimonas sp.]MDD7765121.1 acyl-CoA dehydratase activase [Peptoniphilaceae bacterium]MDY3051491.1 acyl-CoA dehydratase activase [Parvimonas sp.]
MNFVGIDIGSTASKIIVLNENKNKILHKKLMPSGWNSKETSEKIKEWLNSIGYTNENSKVVATGYGRISVPYANKVVTEITCHAKGVYFLMPKDLTIIDIGGQDTKIIISQNGKVMDFIMNDKCSAGTGKFLEIMANRLGTSLKEIFDLAKVGNEVHISSTCTVFAESEIISLMGSGTKKEDIAKGVVTSIVRKVVSLADRKEKSDIYFLSGGFSKSDYVLELLEKYLNAKVFTNEDGQFAGALGAALSI